MFNGLLKYKHIKTPRKINYKLIPIEKPFNTDEEGANAFNAVMEELDREEKKYFNTYHKKFNKIVRTPSNGISYARGNFKPPMYDIRTTSSMIELTIVADNSWRLQFRRNFNNDTKDGGIAGSQAFKTFLGVCKKFGVDLTEFGVSEVEGKEIKKQIPRPRIEVYSNSFLNKELHNVHHIDLNSSHISGMVEAVPQLFVPFNYIYCKRKENELYKAVLVESWGYMQSQFVQYRYSNLAKSGLDYTNRRLEELTKELIKSGRVPILYNTDGIWYQGDIYHGKDEGTNLGQWKNDHSVLRFRVKSAGSYEYEEIDKYTGEITYKPVVRGNTKLDKIKPRTEWVWGDIYSPDAGEVLQFNWNESKRRVESYYGKL